VFAVLSRTLVRSSSVLHSDEHPHYDMTEALETKKTFLSSPHFAVVGASKDQTKWGTKVLQWYLTRDLDVTPVHPKEGQLEGVKTVDAVQNLPEPDKTSISVITNAKITLGILEQAKALNVPAVWCQPGATDKACVDYIKENGMEDKVIYGGPCILVEGDDIRAKL